MFYIILGKAFAKSSRSTSLQRVAVRRVVSLLSCYFLQKPFPRKGCWGSCGYGSCLKNIIFLSTTRGCCSTLCTPLPASLALLCRIVRCRRLSCKKCLVLPGCWSLQWWVAVCHQSKTARWAKISVPGINEGFRPERGLSGQTLLFVRWIHSVDGGRHLHL